MSPASGDVPTPKNEINLWQITGFVEWMYTKQRERERESERERDRERERETERERD